MAEADDAPLFEPVGAIHAATARIGRMLFQPFDVANYLTLALAVWLWHLGGSWQGSGMTWSNPSASSLDLGPLVDTVDRMGWPVVAGIAAATMALASLFWVILAFLRARGNVIVIDDLARERAALSKPWSELSSQANQLWALHVSFGFVVGTIVVVVIGLPLAIAVTRALDGTQAIAVGFATGSLIVVGLFAAFVIGVVVAVIDDLVAPLMVLRQTGMQEAAAELGDLVRVAPLAFVIYLVARVLISLVIAAVASVLSCSTCGAASILPFAGTLLLLPLLLGVRAFTLEFLGQLSPELRATLQESAAAEV